MTDWENAYQEGETPWDKGEPSPCLVHFLEENRLQGHVLVPGCGLGHDVRAIAATGTPERVAGLDISPTAVRLAAEIPGHGLEDYLLGDLFDLDASLRNAFDWVWEHTCFCAIQPSERPAYVEAIHATLRPGGKLLAVFYLDPYDDDHPEGGPPFGASREEIRDHFAGYFDFGPDWVPERAYPGREGREWMMLMTKIDSDG